MRIVDTHSHLFDESYKEDLNQVVARAKESGIEKIFLPNIDESSISSMCALCESSPRFFYPMMGLHPTEVRPGYESVLERMESLLSSSSQYIGIGEVGLDFYWDRSFSDGQIDAFHRQIEWSVAYNLPLMIHSRAAQKELVDTLLPYRNKGVRGVFHCFGGTEEEAAQFLSFDGFMIGINGIITFKKSSLPQVLAKIPLERIVLETDAPYLAPVPHRGKRNESSYIRHTLGKVSEIYGLPEETVAEQTRRNALEAFPRADN